MLSIASYSHNEIENTVSRRFKYSQILKNTKVSKDNIIFHSCEMPLKKISVLIVLEFTGFWFR